MMQYHAFFFQQQASAHAVGYAAGLVVDFLQHEVVEAALFKRLEVYVNLFHVMRYFLVVEVSDFNFFACFQQCHFVVVEVNHLLGVGHDWHRVRRDEELLVVLAHADYNRAALPCHYDFVRTVIVYHGYGVCSDDSPQSHHYRAFKVFAVFVLHKFYELHQYFRVGGAFECVAFAFKIFLQACVVLDNAVVYECQSSALRHVRMCVYG